MAWVSQQMSSEVTRKQIMLDHCITRACKAHCVLLKEWNAYSYRKWLGLLLNLFLQGLGFWTPLEGPVTCVSLKSL